MTREEYFANLKSAEDALHYGVGHLKGGHSGRYPYGSGKDGKKSTTKVKESNKDSKANRISNQYYEKASRYENEVKNLLEKHPKLKQYIPSPDSVAFDDFDIENIEDIAKQYGANTDKVMDAYIDALQFYTENEKEINYASDKRRKSKKAKVNKDVEKTLKKQKLKRGAGTAAIMVGTAAVTRAILKAIDIWT